MHDSDRSDWLAFLIILVVFAALMAIIISLGTDTPLPFFDS